ncbi:unnamed protein product [Caenorhabditis sp. 36 PRJEB53466]|nr:unnamed protein product [Caenorhabditis sp. 36 PRJEB53466]
MPIFRRHKTRRDRSSSDESRMSFEHRSVVRLFSNSSTTSNGSRKTSVPSAVIASAPLMSAAIGDGLGTHLCGN